LAEEGNGIQMSTLGGGPPPAWVQDVEAIQQCLTEIQQRMDQLQSMHATRVGSVFGRDLDDMEGRIEKMTSNLTDQFRFAERLLQKVGQATRRAGGEEATVGANVQRRYVLYYITLSYRTCITCHPFHCADKLIVCFRLSIIYTLKSQTFAEQSMTFRQRNKYLGSPGSKSGGLTDSNWRDLNETSEWTGNLQRNKCPWWMI
jgi:hypothetical protein